MPKPQTKIAGQLSVGSMIQRIPWITHLTHPCVQLESRIWSMRAARSTVALPDNGAFRLFDEHAQSALPGGK